MFIPKEEKLTKVEKNHEVEIDEINMDKKLVGGVLIRSDVPDLADWVTPYEVTEETAHDYMDNCQVLAYMHGDVRNLIPVKKNLDLGFEEPGETEYASVVDSMFFSKEIIDMVKDGKIIAGDWYIVAKVKHNKVLEQIKSGEIKSFSIAGKALVEEVEDV